MRPILCVCTLTFAFLTPAASSAEIKVRPGLWEVTAAADLLWFAPQIPPEQMQQLKELAEQYGVDLPQIRMGEATSKACITQEMANQNTLPTLYQEQLGCNTTSATRSGNEYRFDFICSGGQLQGNGTAVATLTSPESFSGKTEFEGTLQGNPVREQADIRGRWANASCGTANPS